jgi:two-component system chemotaxis response regulator CheY
MSKLILDANDSPSMRMLLKASLSANGFAVETAEDGVEGLERLGQLSPDLLITDINMPRMDGFELIARGAPPRTPDPGAVDRVLSREKGSRP